MSQAPPSLPRTPAAASSAMPSNTMAPATKARDEIGARVIPGAATGQTTRPGESSSSSHSHVTLDAETHSAPDSRSSGSSPAEIDPELAGLDALEDGRPGERPAYPFTTLIRYAIKGSPNGRLLLEDIYNAIQTRYTFFATAPAGWKNSVRHTLSLMTCFEKVPRLLTEPGKGSYWTVNDSMPHAKPSRVRVRKRKTRLDDDETLLATPRSVPDALQPEPPNSDHLAEPDPYRELPPSARSVGSARRHSPYVHEELSGQYSGYNYDMGQVKTPRSIITHVSQQYGGNSWYPDAGSSHRPVVRTRNQSTLETTPSPLYNTQISQPWTESQRNEGFSGGSTLSDDHPRPVDYRLVLMSDLEKLRNVIGRREDIDKEWCRLMVERLRGTGLDF